MPNPAENEAPKPGPLVTPASPAVHPSPSPLRGILRIGGILLVIALVLWLGVPWVYRAWTTASTDDAYVSDYVTFVAPRVSGQVVKVLVEDNNRVHEGDKLVELDPIPYDVQVKIAQSAVDTAKADLEATTAETRGLVAKTRSLRFALKHAIEQVDNQIALLWANVATLASQKATLTLAQANFDRAAKLIVTRAISQEEYDQFHSALLVAEAQVKQALEGVYQIRVSLGLKAIPDKGKDLTDVPDGLDESFSSVRQTQAQLMQSAAELGVVPSSYDLGPKQMIDEFLKRGDSIDQIYNKIVSQAPAIKQAQAKLEQAISNLKQAQLNRSYCTVYAEIDGIVSRRTVNEGNNLQAGQQIMALQSTNNLWVDANFKETQLDDLRIGQRAELYVDMYGSRHVFKGHISGFTMGTGSTLALLPPENATGNFVKIVQRLPVRIEVDGYHPDKFPLFIGLSVTPYVFIKEKPTGEHAGEFLQPYLSSPGSSQKSPGNSQKSPGNSQKVIQRNEHR
jgi:membrane fusion protein, multidrug efflux system